MPPDISQNQQLPEPRDPSSAPTVAVAKNLESLAVPRNAKSSPTRKENRWTKDDTQHQWAAPSDHAMVTSAATEGFRTNQQQSSMMEQQQLQLQQQQQQQQPAYGFSDTGLSNTYAPFGGAYGGMGSIYGGGYGSPYSSYGMMPPGAAYGMGAGALSNLNQFLFSVQSVIFSLGQAVQIIGMNTQALKQLLDSVSSMVDHALASWNEMRRLEAASCAQESEEDKKKRRRLKAFRWTLAAAVSYLGYRIVRRLFPRRPLQLQSLSYYGHGGQQHSGFKPNNAVTGSVPET